MANDFVNSKYSASDDLVKKNAILRDLVVLEEKARREWNQKWGFYLDFDKFCVEEALRRGMSEAEFRRITTFRKAPASHEDGIGDLGPSSSVPTTSSGFVGWRSRLENSLEIMGPLYVSPLHTLPKEPHVSHIILG